MARGRSQGPSRRGVDLAGIISPTDREDLITLVSRITEKMIRQIGDSFDSPPPAKPSSGALDGNSAAAIPVPGEDKGSTNDQHGATGRIITIRDLTTGLAQQEPNTSTSTCSVAQLNELKKEVLVAFKKWQSTVIQRVRDIRVAGFSPNEHSDGQVFYPGNRGFRGGRGGFRGGRGRGNMVSRTVSST
jgi:hypothetical protein